MKSRILFVMAALFTAATSFAAINAQKYYMTLANATVAQGGTVEVALSLNNENAVTSWQTTIALPEGVTLVEVKAAGTRYAEAATPVVEGNVIACECETPLTGTEGVVATVVLKVAENVAVGDVKITLSNDQIVDEAGKNWKNGKDHESTLTITEAAGINGDLTDDGYVDASDIQIILNDMAAGTNDLKNDLTGDGYVDASDIQVILNIMAAE